MEKCTILGVNVCVTNMEETINIIKNDIEKLRGKYICVSNVHTVVMAYDNAEYMKVQNEAEYVLPDGKPLSIVSKKRGHIAAERVAGPDLMEEMFKDTENGCVSMRHFFYGGTQRTIDLLKEKVSKSYPKLEVVGYVSPPFRNLNPEEDREMIRCINMSGADILWVGLGAPKQERWMYEHRDKINAVMIGVGAGFDFHAGVIKRAPKWMQRLSLEWLYRMMQEPQRLFKRYFRTNIKFLIEVRKENKCLKNQRK